MLVEEFLMRRWTEFVRGRGTWRLSERRCGCGCDLRVASKEAVGVDRIVDLYRGIVTLRHKPCLYGEYS